DRTALSELWDVGRDCPRQCVGAGPRRIARLPPAEALGVAFQNEALGWSIKPRRWELVASTELDEVEAQEQLEAAGVWVIARQHAPIDNAGNVRWSHGLIP